MKKEVIIDILMTITLLLLMSAQRLGDMMHEVLGVLFFILFVFHMYFNRKWWTNLRQGKYNVKRGILTFINMTLLIDVLLMILSGMIVSRVLFVGLIPLNKNIARSIHLIGSYYGFIVMSMHIGIHITPLKKKIKIFNTKLGTVLYLLVSVLGIYTFLNENIGEILTNQSEFVFINYSESILLFLIRYLSMMILFAGIGYYMMKIKKLSIKKVILTFVACLIVLVVGLCGFAMLDRPNTEASNTIIKAKENNHILIVYFSRAAVTEDRYHIDASAHASVQQGTSKLGRNEEVAQKIQSYTDADMYELVTKSYYPTNYELTTLRGLIERQMNISPELLNLPESIDQYDTIYIGYPAWWGDPPMSVKTFLESYDFSNKTIKPFQISIDTPATSSEKTIKSWAENAQDVYDANDLSDESLKEWISR